MTPPIDLRRLRSLVDACAGRRVLVAGDFVADEFIYGRVQRVSREAPVLILQYDATEIVAGGAGNAANNVATLGGVVRAVGLVGRDESGRRLTASLDRRVSRAALLRPRGYPTPTKTRILAGGIHSAKQQVVRIDRTAGPSPDAGVRARAAERALAQLRWCDAVLLSDYGTGLVTPRLASQMRARLAGLGRRHVPVLIDSRYDLTRYRRLAACTPNESEVEHVLGVRMNDDDPRALERAGRTLLERTRMQAVLITRGSRGMALFEPRRSTVHIPVHGTDEIADVTGAGDTVIAAMTLALAAGASFHEAARLANYAGGIVVMKRGTATVSAAEVREAVEGEMRGTDGD